jgi:colanic acid/amylovoran biosynthesis glycosyltransferase
MSSEELQQAREISADRRWVSPWQILSVGRLVPVKGFDLAIRALGELRRNRPELDWNFTLVGDGTARQSLEALARECGIADWTTFTGALPFQQVQEHYAAAHVAIMPGIKEGWPKIIAEAWAHGTIPVAASAGLVPWILQDENAGVVFKPNPAALADALARLLQSPLRMHEMSEGLYCHADELSLEQFQARLERVLVQRCALR